MHRGYFLGFAVAVATTACGARSELVGGSSGAGGGASTGPGSGAGASGSSSGSGAGATACTSDGWCWVNPLPQGLSLDAVWGSGPSDIWAAGAGVILHGDGHDVRVDLQSSNDALTSLWGTGPDDVWLTGYETIRHFDGQSWSTAFTGHALALESVWGTSPSDAWAVGFHNEIAPPELAAILHWDGKGWSTVSVPQEVAALEPHTVWASAPDDVWIGTAPGSEPGPLVHFDGAAWRLETLTYTGQPIQGFTSIWGSGKNDVWALASQGPSTVFEHFDGTSWTSPFFLDQLLLESLSGTGPNDVWATGPASSSAESTTVHFQGTVWKEIAGYKPPGLAAIWAGGKTAWAVGQSGMIAEYDKQSWSPTTMGPTTDFTAVWAASPTKVFAAGSDRGRAAVALGNGDLWANFGIAGLGGASSSLGAIWGTSADDIWAAGTLDGRVLFLHANPKGVWRRSSYEDTGAITGLWGSSPSDIWAVGSGEHGGLIAHYDGSSWQKSFVIPSPPDGGDELTGVWGSGPNDVWAVGLSGIIAHDDGRGWSVVPSNTSSNLEAVWGSGPGDVWIVAQDGFLLRGSVDHLERVELPNAGGNGSFAIWGSSATDVWIGTAAFDGAGESVLLHGDGSSFQASNASTDTITGIFGTDAAHVWIVGNAGAVLRRER